VSASGTGRTDMLMNMKVSELKQLATSEVCFCSVFICQSVYVSFCLCLCASSFVCACLCMCMVLCVFEHIRTHVCVCVTVCRCVGVSVCLCVCVNLVRSVCQCVIF